MVLREDAVKIQTGSSPTPGFYRAMAEFGPGMGPLRQYHEELDPGNDHDTIRGNINPRSMVSL